MKISRQSAKETLERTSRHALKHTEIVLVSKPSANGTLHLSGWGSGILVRQRHSNLLVTCHHVTSYGSVHHYGASRLEEPRIPRDPGKHAVNPALLIASNPSSDLAILQASEPISSVPPKSYYDLSRSDFVTEEMLTKNIGTAAVICGPSLQGAERHESGYFEAPIYSALGPLTDVRHGQLVADMAEADFLFKDSDLFPQLKEMTPSGGPRNLKGISGSGLWLLDNDDPVLAGIVLGPNPGASDTHLIRITPIWSLREWMSALYAEGTLPDQGHKDTSS
jgi:hypothetical protein